MKIQNKQELQQIAYGRSSDIDIKDFMNLYKKNALQNHILFKLLMLLLHQVILHVLERIFWIEYKNKS